MATDPNAGVVDKPVRLVSAYQKLGTGVLPVREWSEDERTKRAMKRLAICWVGMFIVVAVPPHIPWFIAMFIAGPIAALLAYKNLGTIRAGEVNCPDCGAAVQIEEQPASWPINARCKSCSNFFTIEKGESAAPATATPSGAEKPAESPHISP